MDGWTDGWMYVCMYVFTSSSKDPSFENAPTLGLYPAYKILKLYTMPKIYSIQIDKVQQPVL
jgi:hypothetical protein